MHGISIPVAAMHAYQQLGQGLSRRLAIHQQHSLLLRQICRSVQLGCSLVPRGYQPNQRQQRHDSRRRQARNRDHALRLITYMFWFYAVMLSVFNSIQFNSIQFNSI